MLWIVFPEAKNGERDALGNDDKKSVLEPQRVALDLASINEFQQLRPELPLQRDRRIAAEPAPEVRKRRAGATKGDRILPEFDTNRQRIGRQRHLQCHDAVEPREKQFRLFWIEDYLLDLDKLSCFKLAGDPVPPIRGDSNEFLAFLFLATGEIVRHPALNVRPLLNEIALGFENGPPDQRVEAAVHFRHAAFEIES